MHIAALPETRLQNLQNLACFSLFLLLDVTELFTVLGLAEALREEKGT